MFADNILIHVTESGAELERKNEYGICKTG